MEEFGDDDVMDKLVEKEIDNLRSPNECGDTTHPTQDDYPVYTQVTPELLLHARSLLKLFASPEPPAVYKCPCSARQS